MRVILWLILINPVAGWLRFLCIWHICQKAAAETALWGVSPINWSMQCARLYHSLDWTEADFVVYRSLHVLVSMYLIRIRLGNTKMWNKPYLRVFFDYDFLISVVSYLWLQFSHVVSFPTHHTSPNQCDILSRTVWTNDLSHCDTEPQVSNGKESKHQFALIILFGGNSQF